ncbi:GTPase IMAP family member 8-like isoform X2 [Parambassis ranga]|nr:GTPase IMAP family member 8-like isoform X2 [Parambassis ranga]
MSLSHVVVLLLGEKQSGKTSAGNAILGRRDFHNKTTRSCKKSAINLGIQVTVVDTPGWLSHSRTPDSMSRQIVRGLTLCQPEPHVILLVLPTSASFGPEEWRAMEAQLMLLRIPIWQRAMVLFTHVDKLALPIQEYIRRQGHSLQWLLERCGNRYQVMTTLSSASEAQVAELFQKIHKLVEDVNMPRETRYRMYMQLRHEITMKEERRWRRREEIEMTEMHDGRMTSYIPRGRPFYSPPTIRASNVCVTAGLPAGWKPALSLILLGRRRSGKSSAGNIILDREQFQVSLKTQRCSVGHGNILGWPVTVVDTPGWSLFGLANPEEVRQEVRQSPSLCPMGSKVMFLLAVPVDSFGDRDRRAVETYLSVLGTDVWSRTVVLFTYGDLLHGKTVESYVQKKGQPLQWVLDRCGRRHHVFAANMNDKTQVHQLLEKVERL